MPGVQIPEGVEIQLIEDGVWIDYKGKRAWGHPKRIRIDRLWRVLQDGKIVGHIRYRMITREQRTPGRMYVNSRWQSPGFEIVEGDRPITSIHGGPARWSEVHSKSYGIERLTR